ncbi:MAG: hypothetical protein Q4D21_01425 [Phascolarctobacterium sp.]|nr:hypothetical protein [Phascolarctobacterium sp.]
MNKRIFAYIKENMNEDDVFTSSVLPDDPHPSIPHPFGSEDSFFYTTEIPSDTKAASMLLKILRDYLKSPSLEKRVNLYRNLQRAVVVSICDPIVDAFTVDDITDNTLELARQLFYNSSHREPLKFAYLLFGLYGMEEIYEHNKDLWNDLFTAAHCEEFTFHFLYACRITNFLPQKEIWQLIASTKGWGKVFAISEAVCDDEAKALWLVKNAYDLDIEYHPLSLKVINTVRLDKILQGPQLDHDTYRGAMAIVNSYLILMDRYPVNLLEENFNMGNFSSGELLKNLLKQAQGYCDDPEDVLDIIGLRIGLENLLYDDAAYAFGQNTLHLLIAECERLIFSRDWTDEVKSRIIVDGKVNYNLADFAYELEIDIWDELFNYWCHHPRETKLFAYLLSYEGQDRSELVMHSICANIRLFQESSDALLVPLNYLRNHPGEGESIIITSLTGMYDWPRGVATATLEAWDRNEITPAIREALMQGLALSNNPVVSARIEALLKGEDFSIQEPAEELN